MLRQDCGRGENPLWARQCRQDHVPWAGVTEDEGHQ